MNLDWSQQLGPGTGISQKRSWGDPEPLAYRDPLFLRPPTTSKARQGWFTDTCLRSSYYVALLWEKPFWSLTRLSSGPRVWERLIREKTRGPHPVTSATRVGSLGQGPQARETPPKWRCWDTSGPRGCTSLIGKCVVGRRKSEIPGD